MSLNTGVLKKTSDEREAKRKASMGKDFYSMENGANVMRILPRSLKYFTKEGDDDFAVRYYVHYNMFSEDGYRMIVCHKTLGKECPICKAGFDLTDKSASGKIRARERFMYNVFDVKEGKLKILETGPKIYEEILKFVLNPEWGDLFGVQEGRSITINKVPAEKSGTGWTDYSVVPSPKQENIKELLPKGWDDEIDKLQDRLPAIFDDKEIARVAQCFVGGKSPAAAETQKHEEVNKDRAVELGGQKPAVDTTPTKPVPTTETVHLAETKDASKPECFSKEYSPRLEKCKPCPVREECRTAFLKI